VDLFEHVLLLYSNLDARITSVRTIQTFERSWNNTNDKYKNRRGSRLFNSDCSERGMEIEKKYQSNFGSSLANC